MSMHRLRPFRTAFAYALLLAGLFHARSAPAAPSMVPGEVIIKFKPGASAAAVRAVMDDLGATAVKHLGRIRAEEHRITRRSVLDAVKRFRQHPAVEFIEPNWILHADVVPNDSLFPQQWALLNTGQTGGAPGADIRATSAWDIETGSPDVVIAIVDTGTDYTHPDLAPNIWTNLDEIPGNEIDDDANGFVDDVYGFDFRNSDPDPMDDSGHGTHVSGTVAAVGNNGIGIAGVAWNAKIMPLKFLDAQGSGSTSDAVQCIGYAIRNGARILNLSWGGEEFSQALELAIEDANAAGLVCVAAAGNSGLSIDQFPHFPAGFTVPNVIAVAASTEQDELASFSNFGRGTVPIAAPGTNIWSTFPGGTYLPVDGTSMAAPHVSGALALLWSKFPEMPIAEMKMVLAKSADPIPALAGLTTSGGRLNLVRMLAGADSIPPDPIVDLTVARIESNRITLRWTATGDDGRQGSASRYDVRFGVFPIDESTFAAAAAASPVPVPQPAGSAEEISISGLEFDATYYVAVKAIDEYGNTAPISNLASGRTGGPPDIDVSPASLTQSLLTGQSFDQTITVRNASVEGFLDFTVESAPSPPAAQAPQPSIVLAKGEADPRVGDPVVDGRGGPDLFGHVWLDSDQPGGPVFSWVDISAIGTPIALSGDENVSTIVPIGFTFPYYGGVFDFVRVTSNGYLSFTSGSVDFVNQPLPAPFGPENMVAPFWDDLFHVGSSATHAYGDGDRFIVQWGDVEHFGGGGPYTFQAILQRDGTIVYQYRTMGNPLSGATIGIQNASRSDGLTVVFNHGYVHDGLAIRITAAPRWLSVSPLFGKLGPGQSMPVAVHFAGSRLADGDYDGAVRIQSNDPDESSLSIPTRLNIIGAPDISVPTGPLTFFNLLVGAADSQSLFIGNDGALPLHVSEVNATPAVFEVDAVPFSLAPGETREMVLRFRPVAPGTVLGSVTFLSDDPDEGTATVPLFGSAIAPPRAVLEPTRLQAAALPGDRRMKSLRVRNTGVGALQWSAPPESLRPPWISIAPSAGTVAPSHAADLVVTFEARSLAAGEYGATVPFSTNDPAAPAVPVELLFHVGSIDVAAFELDPDPINRKHGDRWIVARVELPRGLDPAKVVLSTVKLLGTVPAEDRTLRVEDFNRNNIPDLRFRFERAAVLAALPEGKRVEVSISGEIEDQIYFLGKRAVHVVPSRDNGKDAGVPQTFALHQNTPNPFNPTTTIRFDLPAPARATLRVYGVDGRLAREWVLGPLPAGRHHLQWDGRDSRGRELSSGVYLGRIQVDGERRYDASLRMLLVK